MDSPDNPINPRERLIHIFETLLKAENHLKVIHQGLLYDESASHFCDVVDSANQILRSTINELDGVLLHILFLEHQGILPPPEEKLIFFERKQKRSQRDLGLPPESEPELDRGLQPDLEE